MGVVIRFELNGQEWQSFESNGYESDEVNFGQSGAAASSEIEALVQEWLADDDGVPTSRTRAMMRDSSLLQEWLCSSDDLARHVRQADGGLCFGPWVVWVKQI